MSKLWRKLYLISVACIILLGPAIFYLIVKTGKNNYIMLDYYGPKVVNANVSPPDTVYHCIPPFAFIDQQGDSINESFTAQRIWALMFVTSTDSDHRPMLRAMQDAVYEYKDDSNVVFVTCFIDSVHDDSSNIYSLTDYYKVKPYKWKYFRGANTSMHDFARTAFQIPVSGNSANGFSVAKQLFLMDRYGHIRGIYDATDLYEVKRLKDEIKVLEYEQKHNGKNGKG